MNSEIPDVQAGFRKGRGTRDQIANICWIIEKARETVTISIPGAKDSWSPSPQKVNRSRESSPWCPA